MFTAEIVQDLNPMNPREFSSLGEFFLTPPANKKLSFLGGEETENLNPSSAKWENYIVLPLFVYDHSGVSFSVDPLRPYPFNDRWDSAHIGLYGVKKEKVLEEYQLDSIERETIEIVRSALEGEIKTLNQYLAGDVWGFSIEYIPSPWENDESYSDSCGGFYGRNPETNGMCSIIPEKYKQAFLQAVK